MSERRTTAASGERDTPASQSIMDDATGTASRNLLIDSATGVGVSLSVAGPGARAYAFIIDWCIRLVLAGAWYVVAATIYHGRLHLATPLETDAAWFIFVIAPTASLYLLYHTVLEVAMRGRTPGKRMAGIRIAARDGSVPSVPAIVIRNVFRIIDSFPLVYGVGMITAIFTSDSVRIGDMAAGTVLVYERNEAKLLENVSDELLGTRLDAATAEVVNEFLRRWPTLDAAARRRLAIRVLTREGVAGEIAHSEASSTSLSDQELRALLKRLARGELLTTASTANGRQGGEPT